MARVLLYNIPPEKAVKIRLAAFRHGMSCVAVEPAAFSHPLGYLLGLAGYAPAPLSDESFREEMLVMEAMNGAFLDELRAARIPVALKAVVTPHNAAWSSLRLHEELQREHEAMRAAGRSVHKSAKRGK